MRSFSVFDVRLDDVTETELLSTLSTVRGLVVTPNPEILLAARHQEKYRLLLSRAALSVPDGIATRFAVAALHLFPHLHRHPGVDVVEHIFSLAALQQEHVVILGGYAEDHARLQERVTRIFPNLRMTCYDPGSIDNVSPTLPRGILDSIHAIGPALVLVALGQGKGKSQGKQEVCAEYVLASCSNVRFAIGVGGAIDMLCGRVIRAPKFVRNLGFEWLWRLFTEPWRLKRIFRATLVFPIIVVFATLRTHTFLRATRCVFRSFIPTV